MRFTFLAASILTALARADYEIYQPEQIHLALRQDASEMSVQWSAAHGDDVQIGSTVMWGLSEKELTEKAEGDSVSFLPNMGYVGVVVGGRGKDKMRTSD